MNRTARDMMRMRDMARRGGRDGRNPYGSRGGYVSDRRGGYDRNSDYNYDREYGRGQNDRHFQQPIYSEHDMAIQRNRQSFRDNGSYDMIYDMGYDMNYERGYDMARGMRGDRIYDGTRRYGSFNYETEDYHSGEEKLSMHDLKKWESELINADGTKGKKYDVEQVKQVAQQHNIKFEKYSPELLAAIVNMKYSDDCKVLGSDLNLYVRLAKAFLEDDDFDGTPEEKAMLYYRCIVEKDD